MLRPFDEHPIAALASGSGPGAVGIIRISGHECWRVAGRCLNLAEPTPDRKATLKNFIDPDTHEIIDDLVCTFFKGPRSFTGQDTVELCCHGGPYIIQRILGILYAQGVRPATAGEFTKRALLNGKMDMTAAEGIRDLVEAQSRQQWLAGRQLYSGKLRLHIDRLRTDVIGAMAYLEAMIDFPDEGDTAHVGLQHVSVRLQTVKQTLADLVTTFTSGQVASRGLMVAIIGSPNAGKSTLLNHLLGKQRAIVSDIAGTTRDYIEETCLIDGRLIRLVDTAGIRETDDQIEKFGVTLSNQIMSEADVILLLVAANSNDHDRQNIENLTHEYAKPFIKVMTKSDLGTPSWSQSFMAISCVADMGLDKLKAHLASIVDNYTGSLDEHPFLTSQRQKSAILNASQAISKFEIEARQGAGPEMLAFELQEAARALSSVVGDISNEDILDKVFSEFCIGK